MRTVRLLLLVLGAAAVAYGSWLLLPQLGTTLPWLIGGPLLHDALAAPLIGLVGLALGRLVTDRVRLAWITAGLMVSATLVLIAVPLLWRPPSAPPNPGLPDRNYPLGLAAALATLWAAILIVLSPLTHRRPRTNEQPPRVVRPGTPTDDITR
ncbi:hypothetical protein [Micromonospora sp. NBC_01796]|uniref:hypothetical protein n=1 Tax=Micromonospora sp. NBC_01796 TaxID=2975987 RepID=UPI002DD8DD54|nr:hypothetical protein [Micromonospora sp. NBC_01796]WSA86023.1 hypothetical protein OIE47_37750 [Micromonospora sp. NBC_01796]